MFSPAIHTATNKPVGLIGKPVDARTYFFDSTNLAYRPYVDTAEVLAYLNTAADRTGHFPIVINTGGSLSGGVITGGANAEWWFKDGVADGSLVAKGNGSGGFGIEVAFDNTLTGLVIAWQTDLVPGFSLTYAQVFGNNAPRPLVDVTTGVTDELQRVSFDFKYKIVSGLLTIATLDWSITYTDGGKILF